eukprot:scaffold34597_cov177-Amphora_coffeaeformis.AAC.35
MLTPFNSPNRRDTSRRFDDEDDDQSVDLLADTPPPKGAAAMAAEVVVGEALGNFNNDTVPSSPIVSPATKIIDHLSQPTTDLHYDMSRLDHDVAQILRGVKKQETKLAVPDTSPSSSHAKSPRLESTTTKTLRRQSKEDTATGNAGETKNANPADPPADTEASTNTARAASAKCTTNENNPRATTGTTTSFSAAASLPSSQLSISSQRSMKQAWTVEQYDLGTGKTIATWPSLRTVAREFNMVRHHLKDALQGRRESVRGFGWRLAALPARALEPPRTKNRSSKPRPKSSQRLDEDAAPKTRKRKADEEAKKKELEGSPSKRTRRRVEYCGLTEETKLSCTVSQTSVCRKNHSAPTASRGAASSCRRTAAVASQRATSNNSGTTRESKLRKKTLSSSNIPSDLASVQSLSSYQSARGPIGQRVAQIETSTGRVLKIFRSQREAERVTSIDRKQITKALIGEETEIGGYGWRVASSSDVPDVAATSKKFKWEKQAQPSTKCKPLPEKTKKKGKAAPGAKKTAGNKSTTKKEAPEKIKTEKNTPGAAGQLAELSIGEYRILRFEIFVQGKLGFEIGGCDTQMELKAALECQEGHTGAIERCAMVLGVDQDGVAQRIGLRPGDCFVEEDRSSPGIVTVCGYDDVRSKAKSALRPIVFFVARRKVVFSEFVSKALAENSDTLAIKKAVAASGKRIPDGVAGMSGKEMQDEEKDIHPFCIKCTGKNVRVHHPWCPKHAHFLISGADEILENLKRGMSTNCKLCIDEYTAGRTITTGIHRLGCPRRLPAQVPDSKASPRKKDSEKKQVSKSAKNVTQKVSSKGRIICLTDKFRDAAGIASLVASEENSDVSDFQVREIPKRAPPKSQKGGKGGMSKESQTKKRNVEGAEKAGGKKKKPAPLNEAADMNTGKAKFTRENAHPAATNTATSELSDGEDEASPDWVMADNPWGLDSCQDGDIVVFAPQLPLEQQESAFLSERFEYDPFSTYSRYGKSHTPPEEGLHTLVLRRDIVCKTPWGFSVYRHDFGGACLVQDVVPGSPADTAVFAGGSPIGRALQGVGVNDMIVAVNGKLTSGMTTIEFDVELELSGPSLLLTVSRYKSPKRVIESLVHKEQGVLSKLNDMSKEERHLGWIDYVGGKDEGDYPPADISVASGESNGVSRLGDESQADGNDSSILGPVVDETSLDSEVDPLQHNLGSLIGKSEMGPKPPHRSNYPAKMARQRADVPTFTKYANQEDHENATSPKNTKQTLLSRFSSKTPRLSNRRLDEASLAVVPSKKSPPEDVPKSSMNSSASASALEEEWSDDGNAWLGCVCGAVHDEKKEVFWIQCDRCQSWYNVATECTGMSKTEVSNAEEWLCWACEPAYESGENHTANNHGQENAKNDSLRAYKAQEMEDSDSDDLADKSEYNKVLGVDADDISPEKLMPKFEQDDMVYVEEHAWPGVNNCEGVAKVVAAYMNADGDALYDVKYVVGGKKKGIFEKYLSRHHF